MSANVVTCPSCGTRNRVPAVATGKPACQQCKAAWPWVVSADDETFAAVTESSKIAVLIDLWAPWCGPCRQLSPVLEKLAVEYAGRLKLVKINVDNSPESARRFNAVSIPTMVLIQNGQVSGRQVGALPMPQLKRWLDESLPAAR